MARTPRCGPCHSRRNPTRSAPAAEPNACVVHRTPAGDPARPAEPHVSHASPADTRAGSLAAPRRANPFARAAGRDTREYTPPLHHVRSRREALPPRPVHRLRRSANAAQSAHRTRRRRTRRPDPIPPRHAAPAAGRRPAMAQGSTGPRAILKELASAQGPVTHQNLDPPPSAEGRQRPARCPGGRRRPARPGRTSRRPRTVAAPDLRPHREHRRPQIASQLHRLEPHAPAAPVALREESHPRTGERRPPRNPQRRTTPGMAPSPGPRPARLHAGSPRRLARRRPRRPCARSILPPVGPPPRPTPDHSTLPASTATPRST
ncbi:hypothetical protein SMICM17S_01023 [Streptomyces microflavus]